MKRATLAGIASETVRVTDQGFYTSPRGRVVEIRKSVEAAKRGTVLYALETMPPCPEFGERPPAGLSVTDESTFAALQRLANEGFDHLGCLNFASAKNPGGGFLNGAQAQEEAVCRSSALHATLLCATEYYERNRANDSSIYLDQAIVSPEVPFFRTDDGTFLEQPFMATVVTAPAPNAGAVRLNEPQNQDRILPALMRRTDMVLTAAALHGVRNLVLGAWGCGVFRNDPREVAMVFASRLEPGAPFSTAFERVVFAVYDPGEVKSNCRAFCEVFRNGDAGI